MFKKEKIILKNKNGKIDGFVTIIELKDKLMIEVEIESFYMNKKIEIFINGNKVISDRTNQKGSYKGKAKLENIFIKDIEEIEIHLDNDIVYEKRKEEVKKEGKVEDIQEEIQKEETNIVIDEDIKLKNNTAESIDDIRNDERYIIEVNNVDNLLKKVKKYKT